MILRTTGWRKEGWTLLPNLYSSHSLLPWGWRRHTQNAWSQAGHTTPSYSEQGGARRRRGLPALTESPGPHVLTRGSGEAAGGQDRGPPRDDNRVSSGDGVGVVSTA